MTLLSLTYEYTEAKESEHEEALRLLFSGELTCLVVRNFIPNETAVAAAQGLQQLERFVDHADVPGLKVLGLSHFQVAREPRKIQHYSQIGSCLEALLEGVCLPRSSPFNSLKNHLSACGKYTVKKLALVNVPPLSPFTIRSLGEGVGIEPHQDVLSAESPSHQNEKNVSRQFAVNMFLAGPVSGGNLEIFDLSPQDTGYENLDEGPKTVAEELLPPAAINISPQMGDLVMFDCTKVHLVRPNQSLSPRITLACFLALKYNDSSLYYWV